MPTNPNPNPSTFNIHQPAVSDFSKVYATSLSSCQITCKSLHSSIARIRRPSTARVQYRHHQTHARCEDDRTHFTGTTTLVLNT
jgi:hypothetical protein